MIPTFPAITTLALILSLVAAIAQAGSIYKCKQADGSITFTSTACPSDTVNKEYKGESRGRHASQNSYEGYNSITSQLQQIDRTKAAKRQQRNMKRQRAARQSGRNRQEQQGKRSLSYDDRQRLEILQTKKRRIMSDLRTHPQKRKELQFSLQSIDREIAAMRGTPVVIQNISNSVDSGYSSPHVDTGISRMDARLEAKRAIQQQQIQDRIWEK